MRKVKTTFFKNNEPVDILSIHEWLFEQFYEECLDKGIDLDNRNSFPNGFLASLHISVKKSGKHA